jgi:glycine/D-amino acid oxidase-like deaminating enzyme
MPVITPVSSSLEFPTRADVVIIGAGIIGISAAIELQARGLDVVLLEKGEVAAEQSSRNWGWCRQMGRDPREIPLIKVSLELWRGMNARIGAETGYRSCGIVYLSETEQDLAQHQAWCDANVKQYGLSSRVFGSAEATILAPGATTTWLGGLFTYDDGRAEPSIAVPAMAEYFKSQGGKILTQCAARGVEQQAGRVCGIVTERGSIKTDTVILAGGYWSSRFLGNLNVRFPQSGVISSVLRTSPIDLGHIRTFAGNKFAVRKRVDGGYTIAHNIYSVADLTPDHLRFIKDFMPILMKDRKAVKLRLGRRFVQEWSLARRWALDQVSPFEKVRTLDPQPFNHLLDDAVVALKKIYPAFAGMRIEETWAGMIDATPDAVPVIDEIDAIPGLFMASGFSGHGFGLGPGAGKLMAEIVTNQKPCVDPSPYRFSRFSDGTKLVATTGL